MPLGLFGAIYDFGTCVFEWRLVQDAQAVHKQSDTTWTTNPIAASINTA